MKNLIIYHGPQCSDGFCAAWIAYRELNGQNEYFPINYGESEKIKELLEKIDHQTNVYVLDFSFKPNIIEQMIDQCESFVLLDHHETAEADLKNLIQETTKVIIRFDMTKCGAKLTWEYFHPDQDAPWLVNYVEDRDLWKWKLPDSKEVNSALYSYEKDFDTWNKLFSGKILQDLINEGSAILRYQDKMIQSILRNAFKVTLYENEILVVNSPVLQSEVAGELAKQSPSKIGACYYTPDNANIVRWSLRSPKDGPNVAELAKKFDGGGHKNSAGFEIKVSDNVISGA